MPSATTPLYALNRGEVSDLALARVDIERLRLSAARQANYMPRTLGPMMLRPGTEYIAEVDGSNPCIGVPFIFSSTDTAILEFTASKLRILVNETPITRVAVSTTIAAFASWTSVESETAVVSLGATIDFEHNLKGLSSTATVSLSVSVGDQAKEHALRIVVDYGPVKFRVGTTSGGSDVFNTTSLDAGEHSLAFTPGAATIYVQFESSAFALRRISEVSIESAGIMELPTPYTYDLLSSLRFEASGDTLFIAGDELQQRKIERRGASSYSIGVFKSDDGPFEKFSDDSSTLLTISDLIGNQTITASKAAFSSDHVGSLIRLFHNGQCTIDELATDDTFSETIRVAGVSKVTPAGGGASTSTPDRTFTIAISGTFTGTLTLQRSIESATAGFTDFATYTVTGANTITDNMDNVVVWYRIGFKSGDYTSGSAQVAFAYGGGGGAGIARITGFTSATEVDVEVIKPFLNYSATSDWRLGEWSDYNGYPGAVALFEGRLWFAGNTKIWGSISDAYTSFDIDKTGDSGLISRTIGQGAIQDIKWLMAMQRLVIGGDTSVLTARSNSFDEPLTPTVFSIKDSLTFAASALRAVRIDSSAFFVPRSGRKFIEMFYDIQKTDYSARDLTRLNPDIGLESFVDIAVQREPDTNVWVVRGDGVAAVFLYDKNDEVEAWWRFETDGEVENVLVLPGTLEDRVFMVVKRTINGVTKRYWEKLARIDECQGGTLNKQADCFATYSGVSTTTITGLGHLEGEAVIVWGNGAEIGFSDANPTDPATYTVSGGSITIPTAVTSAIIGLPYTAQFRSAKLAYAAAQGTALNQIKQVDHVGLVMTNTHILGVKHGTDFDNLDDMPLVEDGGVITSTAAAVSDGSAVTNRVFDQYDFDMMEFNGLHKTDARLCLESQAPRPCTINAVTIKLKTNG